MAILNQGILGGISGRVGTVIGGSWKGIEYIRSVPVSVSNPRTPAQQEQRAKFEIVLLFLRSLISVLRIGFRHVAVKMTSFNAAMSYNLKNAVTGAFPAFTIDYTRALISMGSLTGVSNGVAASAVNNRVDFTWDDNSGEGDASATDKAMAVIYNPLRNQSISTMGLVNRSAGTLQILTPDFWGGETVEAYLSFEKDDNTSISDSQWVGSIIVA